MGFGFFACARGGALCRFRSVPHLGEVGIGTALLVLLVALRKLRGMKMDVVSRIVYHSALEIVKPRQKHQDRM